MRENTKERLNWLDLVRCIAILCVVMCHVIEGDIYNFDLGYMQSVGFASQAFAFVMFSMGRIGVPLFLLSTGYLLLNRTYDDAQCRGFWKNKGLGLLVAVEVWIVIYNLFPL